MDTNAAPNLDDFYNEAGYKYNVDPLRIKAHAIQETGEKADVASEDGKSWGFGQFRPETWRRVMPGVPLSARGDPQTAIEAMAKYIAQNDDAHRDQYGNVDLLASTAAYNGSGPQAQAYARKVQSIYGRLDAAGGLHTSGQGGGQAKPAANDDDAFGQTLKASPQPAAPAKAPEAPAADDAFGQTLKGGPAQPDTTATKPDTAAATPEMPSGLPTDPDESGPPSQGASVPEPVRRIGQAVADTWNAGRNPLMSPALQRVIESGGPIGRFITSPLLQIGGWGIEGANALAAGGMAGAAEVARGIGGDALARDVYQGLQVLPEAGRMAALARPPQVAPGNALAGGVDRPYLTPAAQADIAASRPSLLRADANEASPTGVPQFSGGPQMAVKPDAAPPATVPAPVAASTVGAKQHVAGEGIEGEGTIPEPTPAQKATALQKAVNQSAEDRLTPQGRDDNVYVPGVERPEAMKDFSPAPEGQMSTALQHKTLYNTDSNYHDAFDAQVKKNNAVMVDYLHDMIGDANTRDAAMEHARELMPGPVGLFDKEKPVDVQPVVDTINKILAGPKGKIDGVISNMRNILPKLKDADGNPETMPSMLKGVFDDINNKLYDKSPTKEGNEARQARDQLTDVKAALSEVIAKGLPENKWTDYLGNLSAALGQVSKYDFMQKYLAGTKKLTNGSGDLQLNKVQTMLDDIYQQHANRTGGAKEMTMDEINRVEAVRNELQLKKLLDDRAAVRGSPTVQLGTGAGIMGSGPLGSAIKTVAEGGAHLAAAHLTAGVGNVGLLALKGYRAGKQAKAEQKAANALAATKARLLDTSRNSLAQD